MILFLDASSLLKLYLEESGSAMMRALFEANRFTGRFYLSDHVALEVQVRLNRLGRVVSRRERRALRSGFRQFATHRSNHLNILTVDHGLIAEAEALAAQYADSGAGTLDLIHLASARRVQRSVPGERLVFVASDRKLRHVARRAGFRTFDPERERTEDLGVQTPVT